MVIKKQKQSDEKNTQNITHLKKRINLSTYVISFAQAASNAQKILTTQDSAMALKEAEFKVNITTDLEVNDSNEVYLNVLNMKVEEKILTNYKEHFGVEMRFLLVPTGLLSDKSDGGY